MIDIQDFLFKIYTQKSNTSSNLDFNNLDKNSDSSDTTQKNVFEFNQDKSLNHDDSLSNSEQIAFAKQNIQNNVGNCTTSLKKQMIIPINQQKQRKKKIIFKQTEREEEIETKIQKRFILKNTKIILDIKSKLY